MVKLSRDDGRQAARTRVGSEGGRLGDPLECRVGPRGTFFFPQGCEIHYPECVGVENPIPLTTGRY